MNKNEAFKALYENEVTDVPVGIQQEITGGLDSAVFNLRVALDALSESYEAADDDDAAGESP